MCRKGLGIGGGGAIEPFEDVAAPGVVVRQGIGQGIVGVSVALEELFQIPGSGQSVGGGIKALLVIERGEMLRLSPLARGLLADLHEADFLGPATNTRMEAALAPDDSLDEGGFDVVAVCGGADGHVLAVIEPELPTPVGGGSHGEKHDQSYEQGQPAPFHGVLVADGVSDVERNDDFLLRGGGWGIQWHAANGFAGRAKMPKNIVYFDLETQKAADEVGGWDKISHMGMSVGVTYSTATGEYKIYGERSVGDLIRELQRADLVVGFNNLRFDYEVLHGYTPLDLRQLPTLDMLVDLQAQLKHRLSLDAIATATFGVEKTAEGLQAIEWFRQGKLLEIAEYCCYDVKITRLVHEFGVANHKVHYQNRFGKKMTVPVRW